MLPDPSKLRRIGASMLIALAATDAAGADPMKDLATDILTRGIADGDTAFLEAHVAEGYVQHNPQVPDGRSGLIDFVGGLAGLDGGVEIAPVRVLRDGDLVAVHSEARFGADPVVVFDLFRFEDGLAVDRDRTEANRQLVLDFYREVLVQGRIERAADFLGAHYHQHNPQIADGLEGLTDFFEYLRDAEIPFAIERTHRSVAEGNFVLLHSEGRVGGAPHAFFDLFRVEDGRIVEHWDVVQAVPEAMAHENGMF